MKTFLLFLIFLMPFLSSAQEGLLNKLLAPGPLIHGHADLEANACLKCHNVGKGIDNGKCLECHKDIQAHVAARKGFHGLSLQSCISCHSDHKGKTFDSVQINEKTFDHKKTGLVLSGKHAELSCAKCHTVRRTGKATRPNDIRYFKASASCVSCHKKNDVHFYQGEFAKKDCNSCHGLNSWKKDIIFDHHKASEFQLEGKHKELTCAKCHVPSKDRPVYSWPQLGAQKCLSCHTDYHKNNLSEKYRKGDCTTCHGQDNWRLPQFNHEATGYPLKGKHGVAKCTDCHKSNIGLDKKDFKWTGLTRSCLNCHKDIHEFAAHQSSRLTSPNKCESCHQETNWKEVRDFQHNRDTRFYITGKHLPLQCNKCHVRQKALLPERQYHWKALEAKTCENCHKNPHTTAFSKEALSRKCTDCHSAEGWKVAPTQMNKNFNHRDTRFPIDGSHSSISCSACHIKSGQQVFRFPTVEKNFCSDCHQSPHKDQFHTDIQQKSCLECHDTTKFEKLKPFNHDQVHFKLAGSHTKLKCSSCHVPTQELLPVKVKKTMHQFKLPGVDNSSCAKCHDDFHRGTLGKNCNQCHNEQSWSKTLFNHNQHGRFPLKDKHAPLKCSKCHVPSTKTTSFKNEVRPLIIYRSVDPDCYTCHKKNDVHNGNFGKACQDCHNEKGWKQHQDFHKDFRLSGVHYSLTCNECHFNERRLGGMSDNCFLCHQKDDVHYGSIPNCGACHRQSFWEQTTFRHSMTNFPLRGSHRTLECVNCHSNGVYEGTPSQCIDCHLQDALHVTTPDHSMSGLQKCTDCHNQFTFGRIR